jgi:hypothetical protein
VPAKLIQIADDVTAALNAEFTGRLVAHRTYAPVVELEDLGTLDVAVTAERWQSDSIADGVADGRYGVQISLRKRVANPHANGEIDPLVDLADEIARFLLGGYQAENASCTQAEVEYDPDDLYLYSQFTAIVSAEFEVIA